MSLLSNANARPEHLFALLTFLGASDEACTREETLQWLTGIKADAVAAAGDLGWVVRQSGGNLRVTERAPRPTTVSELGDGLHSALVATEVSPEDRRLLEVYALLIWRGTTTREPDWTTGAKVDSVAGWVQDELAAHFPREEALEGLMFNSTKYPAWRRWMVVMGLGWPAGKSGFLVDPTSRIERELARLWPDKMTMSFEDFRAHLAKSMPYLDGGAMLSQLPVAGDERVVSQFLAYALRQLHGAQRLVLHDEVDAQDDWLFPAVGHHPASRVHEVTVGAS